VTRTLAAAAPWHWHRDWQLNGPGGAGAGKCLLVSKKANELWNRQMSTNSVPEGVQTPPPRLRLREREGGRGGGEGQKGAVQLWL